MTAAFAAGHQELASPAQASPGAPKPDPAGLVRQETRVFPLGWPQWQPPGADGLAAIVAMDASTSWADGLLARGGDGMVVWAATAAEPEAQALARLHYPGVRAVTLAPAKSDPRRVRLALEFALHLGQQPERAPQTTGRGEGGGWAGASATPARLTSWSPPNPPPDVVRIPHLVTIQRDGTVTDTVVWELATRVVAQGWLGGPLPDQSFFESRLDALLRLRAAARRGQLPATAVAAGLTELLRDRELSIQLVYEHATLFRNLLTGQPGGPRRRD